MKSYSIFNLKDSINKVINYIHVEIASENVPTSVTDFFHVQNPLIVKIKFLNCCFLVLVVAMFFSFFLSA